MAGQNPFAVTTVKNAAGSQAQPSLDGTGSLQVQNGGSSEALGITSASVIKATAGRLRRLSVISGGAVQLNDCAVVSNGSAGNAIYNVASATAGTVVPLDWPCSAGIVASVVSGTIAISYD